MKLLTQKCPEDKESYFNCFELYLGNFFKTSNANEIVFFLMYIFQKVVVFPQHSKQYRIHKIFASASLFVAQLVLNSIGNGVAKDGRVSEIYRPFSAFDYGKYFDI